MLLTSTKWSEIVKFGFYTILLLFRLRSGNSAWYIRNSDAVRSSSKISGRFSLGIQFSHPNISISAIASGTGIVKTLSG